MNKENEEKIESFMNKTFKSSCRNKEHNISVFKGVDGTPVLIIDFEEYTTEDVL